MSKKAGFYWLLHHDKLLEWCYDEQERIDYIKKCKPTNERETRLKWMKPVKGKLPKAVIEAGEACDKAGKSCDKAWKAYGKAWKAYGKAEEAYYKAREAYDKAGKAYCKAREACDKAGKAYCKAREAYGKVLRDHKDEIEALHAKEQPDCPWDGERLVFPS